MLKDEAQEAPNKVPAKRAASIAIRNAPQRDAISTLKRKQSANSTARTIKVNSSCVLHATRAQND